MRPVDRAALIAIGVTPALQPRQLPLDGEGGVADRGCPLCSSLRFGEFTMRTFLATLLTCLVVSSFAHGQSRAVAPTAADLDAPTELDAADDGSGAAVEERAHDPRANTAAQPERSEGNEDDLDLNEGDDGNNGTGGN